MRQSLFALAATAFLLGACSEPQTSTPAAPPTTVKASVGSPITPRARCASRCCCRSAAAPRRSARPCSRPPKWRFSTPAPRNWRWPPTTAAKPPKPRPRPTARRAPTAWPWCWARCSARRPRRWRRWSTRAAPTSCRSPTTSSAAQRGVWIMGIAAPPQVRRVVDHAVDAGIKRFAAFAPQTSYGEQMVRTLESHVAVRGGTDGGERALRSQQRRPRDGREASGERAQGRGQARRAGAGGAAPPVRGAGRAGRRRHRQQVGAVHRHRRVGRARHRLRRDAARRLVCRARSGAARRLRAPLRRDLRPPAPSPGDARLRRRGARRPAWRA